MARLESFLRAESAEIWIMAGARDGEFRPGYTARTVDSQRDRGVLNAQSFIVELNTDFNHQTFRTATRPVSRGFQARSDVVILHEFGAMCINQACRP